MVETRRWTMDHHGRFDTSSEISTPPQRLEARILLVHWTSLLYCKRHTVLSCESHRSIDSTLIGTRAFFAILSLHLALVNACMSLRSGENHSERYPRLARQGNATRTDLSTPFCSLAEEVAIRMQTACYETLGWILRLKLTQPFV